MQYRNVGVYLIPKFTGFMLQWTLDLNVLTRLNDVIVVMVNNFISRDLGVDAVGPGVRMEGIRCGSTRDFVAADCGGSGWKAP